MPALGQCRAAMQTVPGQCRARMLCQHRANSAYSIGPASGRYCNVMGRYWADAVLPVYNQYCFMYTGRITASLRHITKCRHWANIAPLCKRCRARMFCQHRADLVYSIGPAPGQCWHVCRVRSSLFGITCFWLIPVFDFGL